MRRLKIMTVILGNGRDNSAHPQAYELAHPLHEEFIKRGYIK